MHNLCSSSPMVIPLALFGSYSTIKPVIFLSPSIRVNIIIKLQKPAFEIHIFRPMILYDLPSSDNTAFVFPEFASLPPLGSVKQSEPNHSPHASLGMYFCFCSSVPYSKIGKVPIPV